jgi:hypothetical protein
MVYSYLRNACLYPLDLSVPEDGLFKLKYLRTVHTIIYVKLQADLDAII